MECWQFLRFQPSVSMFITPLRPLYERRSQRHTSMLRAGIRFDSTCPPQQEKPAWNKVNGLQPSRTRTLDSCNVMTGTFPGFSVRQTNRHHPHCHFTNARQPQGPPHDPRTNSRTLSVVAPWQGHNRALCSAPRRPRPQLSCHGTPLQKGGCSFAILSSILRSQFQHSKGSSVIATEKSLIICRAWRRLPE